MCPECPTKNWRGKSCWLNLSENGPEVVQGAGGVTTSSTLLDLVFVWSPGAELPEIADDREVFRVLLGLLSRRGHENE